MSYFTCSFDPEIPEGCPPADATQGQTTVYRALKGRAPKEEDFLSDVRAQRRSADPAKCMCWGCSVWTDEQAVVHALQIIPAFRRKSIATGLVDAEDGAIKHTPTNNQVDHFTFWKAADRDVSIKFSVFIKNNAYV